MPEAHDPLRPLFRQAADAARARTVPAPVAQIAARGRRARRRRIAAFTAGACLVLLGGGALTASLVSGPAPVTTPVTRPSPDLPPSPATTPPPTPDSTAVGPSPTPTPTWPLSMGTTTSPA